MNEKIGGEAMGSVVWIEEADVTTAVGDQAGWYLNGQLSVNVESMDIGRASRALLLQPDGSLVAPIGLHRLAEKEFRLFSPLGTGIEVQKRLERFRLRSRVNFDCTSGCVVHLSAKGANEIAGLSLLAEDRLEGVGSTAVHDVGELAASELYSALEFDEVRNLLSDLNVPSHSMLSRIMGGQPEWGFEITAGMNPTELGESYIRSSADFQKGCYTGQELIERVDSRGYNTPKHLSNFVVNFSDSDSSKIEGMLFESGGKPVFTLTSYQFHDSANCGVALGFVHRLAGEFLPRLQIGDFEIRSVKLGHLHNTIRHINF
ncbi:MAG: hypothetical protein HKL84_08745 [Acidimicrobiaceae bacterium]|nr:hypothetical protein [Acidimicrobiaceae bacterium]